jgi:hypothetical protein
LILPRFWIFSIKILDSEPAEVLDTCAGELMRSKVEADKFSIEIAKRHRENKKEHQKAEEYENRGKSELIFAHLSQNRPNALPSVSTHVLTAPFHVRTLSNCLSRREIVATDFERVSTGTKLMERVETMLAKLSWKREQFSSVPGRNGPFQQCLILVELGDPTQPNGSILVCDRNDIWEVTRSETTTD